MSQYRIPPLNPLVNLATELTDGIEDLQDSLYTTSKGPSRPTYAAAGLIWLDDSTPSQLAIKFFDGTIDWPSALTAVQKNEAEPTPSFLKQLNDELQAVLNQPR